MAISVIAIYVNSILIADLGFCDLTMYLNMPNPRTSKISLAFGYCSIADWGIL
jgi:hypothetical protein